LPILFLLYIAELLEIYNNLKARLSASKFVDNTNILIYRTLTKVNYCTLERVHNKCLG
jgi:hypothetical protein